MVIKLGSNKVVNGSALKCDLDYFEGKIKYLKLLAAEIYRLKVRENYLTQDEKKSLKLMEEDLDLHIKDLEEKCGVTVTREQLFKAIEADADFLQQVSEVLKQFSISSSEKK